MTAVNEIPVTCQVCGERIAKGNDVFCFDCNTPHHLDCWKYTGHCSTFACGCRRFRKSPAPDHTEFLKIDASGLATGHTGNKLISFRVRPEKRLRGSEKSVLQKRLDLETPLEKFLSYGTGLFLCSLIFLPGLYLYILPISLLFLLTRLFVDCTYILDNERRLLLYYRSIFFISSTWKICNFNQIESVEIVATPASEKLSSKEEYAVMLVLPNKTSIRVSDEDDDYNMVAGLGRQIAEHVDAKFSTGALKHVPMTSVDNKIELLPDKTDTNKLRRASGLSATTEDLSPGYTFLFILDFMFNLICLLGTLFF